MQKHIQGTLRDPTGSILPNHKIRITSRSGITELHSVELTDSNGEYSFILTEGWKYLEVLFRNTYLLVGDILINEATPAESTIEEILRYSTPVVVSSIYDLPTGINSLQETLEDGTYTFKREDRDQLIDTLVYKIDLTNSWVSDDMLERGMRDISEVSTCDSSIKDIKQVYSDDKGNSFSHSTGSIKTKDGEVKSEVLVSDTIRVNEDITLGNYSYNLSKDVNATTVANSSTKTKGNVTIQDSDTFTDTSLTKVKYAATEAGTFTDTTNLNSSNYTRNTSFNNVHQTTITINDTLVQDSSTVSINGVVSTDVFMHDGVSTQRNINIDKYVVGREGNDLFEIDSTTDTVTVRGNLRVEDIQDLDGKSLLPDNGDTIFQVFRYGETSTGPWEDILQSYHYWKQENYSVNGYIDPNGWSAAYKFRGEDGTGNDGDTIYYEYQYSPDGATNWSTLLKAGDAFRRERRVVNGNPEAWSDPVRIKGENGDEVEIRSQYSVDGINNWHSVYTSGDMYERRARFINGVQNSAWSDPIKIVGNDGEDGIPGLNGSGWYSIVNGTGVWPGDTQATADFLNTFGRVPQLDDHLFYVDTDPEPTKTDGRRCITPVGDTPIQWSSPRSYFDGDVIVKGTLSANRLVAQSITGNEISSQTTIIAGSGSSTAGINGHDLGTLPDWMGGGSNPYAGYRFWAGSSTPEFANFTVDNNGKMKAIDGEFSGTLTSPIINGGIINGTSFTGVTFTGSTITGATINGGSINGTSGTFTGTVYAENLEGDVSDLRRKTSTAANIASSGTEYTLVTFNVSSLPFARDIVFHGFLIESNADSGGGPPDVIVNLYESGNANPIDTFYKSFSNTGSDISKILYGTIPANTSKTFTIKVEIPSGSNGTAFVASQSILAQAFKAGGTIS